MLGCAGIGLGAKREMSQSSAVICKDKREPKASPAKLPWALL